MSAPLAVVTGASRGIGHAIARQLSSTHRVVILGRNAHALKAVADETGALAVEVDVADADSVASSWTRIVEAEGDPDLLVNNAGISDVSCKLWEAEPEAWWRIQEVNVRGPFLLCRAALPAMVARRSGRIVNVASNTAFNPAWDGPAFIECTSYPASKAALVRLTEVIAGQTREYGVSVFAISPGMVRTDLTASLDGFADMPDDAWTPVERAAELVAHLASGELDALSGRYLHASMHDWSALSDQVDQIVEEDLLTLRVRFE